MIAGFRLLVQPMDLAPIRIGELQALFGGSAQVEVEDISRDVQLTGGFETDSPQLQVRFLTPLFMYFLFVLFSR
jgi:hypothetical protein